MEDRGWKMEKAMLSMTPLASFAIRYLPSSIFVF